MSRKIAAEFIGTFALVSSVCGAALFSLPSAGLMTVAFAIGAKRFKLGDVIGYVVAQVFGGAAAAALFYFGGCARGEME